MKALVYERPGRENGAIREIPVPVCGDDQVLIKVMSCGICKPAELSHDRNGSLLGQYPATPGHEFAGVAVEVGRHVKNVKAGDRVVADNGYQCGTCYYCQHGMPSMCENYRAQGHNMQGGFAQYIACDASKVYAFGEDISFDAASLCELINCALSCVDSAEIHYGDHVAIIGAGSSGSIISQLIRNSGAGRVVVLDYMQSKLDRLMPLGIETVLVDLDDYSKHETILNTMFPNGIDVIIDAAGDDGPLFEHMVKLLAPYGRYVMYSFFYNEPKTIWIEPGLLIKKGLKLVGVPLRMYHFGDCVRALEEGKIDPDAVITAVYRLDRYFEALDEVVRNNNLLKVVIHPND